MTAPLTGQCEDVVAGCPLLALRQDGGRWSDAGVAVVRSGGRLYAFEAQCPHGGVSLADAPVSRGAIVCPSHGARFRLGDGKVLAGPARRPLTTYDAQETPGGVVVRTRREPPAHRPVRRVVSALARRLVGGRR